MKETLRVSRSQYLVITLAGDAPSFSAIGDKRQVGRALRLARKLGYIA